MAGSARRSRRAPPPSLVTMEPTTTETAPAFPIEKVRAAFPALQREVHGRPVAYLDSGAR